ncbi:MAG: HD domain-containing protein [Firmicutes bacterium]|nr:HD domain-containing protein [Bacillota bacterium]
MRNNKIICQETEDLFHKIFNELLMKTELVKTSEHSHHGETNVLEHSLNVAIMCLYIASAFKLNIDNASLIRGALLHDYFLYDWHEKSQDHKYHGFTHPRNAVKNASTKISLSKTEKDMILHHMFPLTILPPQSKEAWILCCADKICAIYEIFGSKSRLSYEY